VVAKNCLQKYDNFVKSTARRKGTGLNLSPEAYFYGRRNKNAAQSGMPANIYGAIAAIVVLPFTTAQMTLMAIFLLTAHDMTQEGIIQARSGLHPLKATLFRLRAATATVMLVAPFLTNGQTMNLSVEAVTTAAVRSHSVKSNNSC